MSWWLVLVLALAALLAVSLLAGLLMFHFALNPRVDKGRVFSAPHNANYDREHMKKRHEDALAWWEGIPHQEVFMQSQDGLRLRAHLARHPGGGKDWAILCHGYTGKGLDMLNPARAYYAQGYSLLLPDLRGHGGSQGRFIGMGWPDRLDVLGWMQQALSMEPEARLVLHGVSMGAATVMMTAGEPLPQNTRAIIADCGYSGLWQLFSYQLKGIFGLPAFPIMHVADGLCRLYLGFGMRQASSLKQLAKAQVPVLFFHGERDTFVPFSMLEEVYAACASMKEKAAVVGAGHGECNIVAGDAYWQRIWTFIRRADASRIPES